MRAFRLSQAVAALLVLGQTAPAMAAPASLTELLALTPSTEVRGPSSFAKEKRRGAMRAAAQAFGARGGLARRNRQLQQLVERLGPQLSAVFRFRDLMLSRHGFTISPPILASTSRAFRVDADGSRAASARRVVRILAPARIVAAPPHWRDYLRRTWAPPQPPVSVLFPRTAAERTAWQGWIRDGWRYGVDLADDIFADDLERLLRAFEGMALWRRAHLARMVSAPEISAVRAAVAGHGTSMRIRETVAAMTARAELNRNPAEWRALLEGAPE